jgi:hypothetical protein
VSHPVLGLFVSLSVQVGGVSIPGELDHISTVSGKYGPDPFASISVSFIPGKYRFQFSVKPTIDTGRAFAPLGSLLTNWKRTKPYCWKVWNAKL